MGEDGRARRGPADGARHGVPALRHQGDALSTRPAGLRDLDDIDAVFSALANEHRRHVLVTLHARGGSMTAGELADRFSHSWSTTTRHLQKLEAAGLVTVEVTGRQRRYRIELSRLRGVVDLYLGAFGG